MAFENVVFPDYPLKHNIQRETIYPIEVRSNGTTEWRGTHVRFEKYRWSLSAQTMTPDQKEAIRSFLVQRQHGLNSFLFKCPMTPTLDAAPMVSAGGGNYYLSLPADGTTASTLHPLYNQVSSQFDGSPTIGLSADNRPIINQASVTGTIYFTVKLVTPLNYALAALSCVDTAALYSVQPIVLQEVFGETL